MGSWGREIPRPPGRKEHGAGGYGPRALKPHGQFDDDFCTSLSCQLQSDLRRPETQSGYPTSNGGSMDISIEYCGA
jgi:hypothetical protein